MIVGSLPWLKESHASIFEEETSLICPTVISAGAEVSEADVLLATRSNFRLPVDHFPAVKKTTIPSMTNKTPITAEIPGQGVEDEEMTKVLKESTSLIALKEVNNLEDARTGSLSEVTETNVTNTPKRIITKAKTLLITIDEIERAAVRAKPASPNALSDDAAI